MTCELADFFLKTSSELREKARNAIAGSALRGGRGSNIPLQSLRNKNDMTALTAVAFLSIIKPLEAFGFVSKNYWLG